MFINITGTITKDDPARFIAVVAAAKLVPRGTTIMLQSDGGDVYAAIEIGRYVRALRLATMASNSCVSACVFILAGGVHRFTDPNRAIIGIHRPFSTDTNATNLAGADARYKRLDSLVRSYFKEMNISGTLADVMLRTPPQDVVFLTWDQGEQYGLIGWDPAEADLLASDKARQYGISKQEYFRRFKRTEKECGGVDMNCYEAIMHGTR